MHQVRCPSLVGRHAELAVLVELLGAARRGAGTVVFLSGEAGIGKSRMAREVSALACTAGLPAVVGRAVSGASSAPLRPFVEATLALARRHGLPDRSELGPYAAVLGPLVPEWATGAPTASGPVLAEGLLRLLRLVAPRGCVVVLEDLHWADPETLAVLEYLGDHIADTGVLLLATLRSGEGDQAWAVSDALAARGSALPMPLTALDDGGVAEMVRACGLDPEAAAPLTAQADGVPLMVEELLGDYDTTIPGGSTTVPRSLADSVRRRVADLDPVDGSVLAAAALLGRRFDWRLVAEALELDATTMTAALASATGAGLLEPDGAGYRFRHALTRDAVLAGLAGPLQAELAAALGGVLHRRSPELPGEAALLAADLAELAGDPSAADLLARAGSRAARDGALDSADRLLTRGLALARPAATRVALSDALADVRCRAGDPDAAAAATAELLAELRSAPDETVRRRAQLRLARAAAEAGRWELAEVQLAAAAVPNPHGPHRPDHGPARHDADAPEADLVRALVLLGRNARTAAAALASERRRTGAGRRQARRRVRGAPGGGPGRAHGRPGRGVGRLREGPRDRGGTRPAARRAVGAARAGHDRPLPHRATRPARGRPGRSGRSRGRAAGGGARPGPGRLPPHERRPRCRTCRGRVGPRRCCRARSRPDLRDRARDGALCRRAAGRSARRRTRHRRHPCRSVRCRPRRAAGIWGFARGVCSLLSEDRAAAVHELETAFRLTIDAAEVRPLMWWGCWALLRAVEGCDAEAAIGALRASPAVVNRHNAAFADLAEAVLAGRRGPGERAAAVVNAFGPRELPWPWSRHLARRLVAEAALADGWGDPRTWAAEAGEFFDVIRHSADRRRLPHALCLADRPETPQFRPGCNGAASPHARPRCSPCWARG